MKTVDFNSTFDYDGSHEDCQKELATDILPTMVSDVDFIHSATILQPFDQQGDVEIRISFDTHDQEVVYSVLCDYINTMSQLIAAP